MLQRVWIILACLAVATQSMARAVAYFAKTGALRGDELGRAMVALAQNPDDAAALA